MATYANFSFGFFFILVAITVFSFLFFFISSQKSSIDSELEQIHEERKEIIKKIESNASNDIFNTIHLSLNRLNEFFTVNKGQAKSSLTL